NSWTIKHFLEKQLLNFDGEEIRRRLALVGEIVRDHVLSELRQQSAEALSAIAFETAADKIYVIDRSVETILLPALAEHLQPLLSFVLICEGVNDEQPLPFPADCPLEDCQTRLIIDPIDGTRPIMYNKRSAWWLAGIAPNRGEQTSLPDIEVAVQVEIPTTRAALADTLWAIRGRGAQGETLNLMTGERTSFQPRPSTATTISGGFASFFHPFPGGKEIFATLEEELAQAIIGGLEQSKTAMFDEQYLSTGGQLYELMVGRDRLLVDVRGRLYEKFAREGKAVGHACHPYDLCTALIAEECGVEITGAAGETLTAPLDTTSDVSWIGYANCDIRAEVEPVLLRLLDRHLP
ncbi:MAG TPA: inositol monophosphatase, partial [Blastocatellia bacterium]|nr:inositol monophosphatase [Blastocatellia bacterium]